MGRTTKTVEAYDGGAITNNTNLLTTGYDRLNQLTEIRRGTLNASKDTIATASRSQSWTPDAAGDFNSVTSDTNPAVSRMHNKQNVWADLSAANAVLARYLRGDAVDSSSPASWPTVSRTRGWRGT